MAKKEFEYTAKVLQVTNVFGERQINITLDTDIKKIDVKTGEEIDSNVLVKRLKTLTDDVANCNDLIRRVRRRSLGKAINPVLLAIVLENADITIKGEFKKKGEKRDFPEAGESDVYTNDCIVYHITNVVTHLTDEDLTDFEEVRREEPYLQVQTVTASNLPSWLKSAKD